jgi:hypothetical protein
MPVVPYFVLKLFGLQPVTDFCKYWLEHLKELELETNESSKVLK